MQSAVFVVIAPETVQAPIQGPPGRGGFCVKGSTMTIICYLCSKQFDMITPSHLKYKHGITVAEYRAMFPDAPMTSLEARANIAQGQRKVWIDKVCPYCGAVNPKVPWEAKVQAGFCGLEHWYAYLCEHPEEHPNWHGGVSRDPWPFEFDEGLKERVRVRDQRRCRLCGEAEGVKENDGRRLAVHHIDFDKDNCDIDNLISLCAECHSVVNHSRDYYRLVFQDRIERGTGYGQNIRF